MSHFTVAVLTNEGDSHEDLLAPYQENNMGDCPEEILEFQDETEEIERQYQTGTMPMIEGPDGKLYYTWDKKFRKSSYLWNNEYEYPEGYKKVTRPYSDFFATIDVFADEYYGYTRNDDGQFGYTTNPNAQWDWYQVGGRWPGMLLLKKGAEGTKGEITLLADQEFKDSAYKEVDGHMSVDSALLRDIDWEKMREVSLKQAELSWEDAQLLLDPIKRNWRFGVMENETKEAFLERTASFYTFAVITPDGEWHEKGSMGWFGASTETEEESKEWNQSFYDTFIKGLDQDNVTLTIVDCHI